MHVDATLVQLLKKSILYCQQAIGERLCDIPYCLSSTCEKNIKGYKDFLLDLALYKGGEKVTDQKRVPPSWRNVFDTKSGGKQFISDAAIQAIQKGKRLHENYLLISTCSSAYPDSNWNSEFGLGRPEIRAPDIFRGAQLELS